MLARLALLLLAAAPAWAAAQVMVSGSFRGAAPDAGWVLSGGAAVTAGTLDAQGQGWLRLTGAAHNALGVARFEGASFDTSRGLALSFDYVAWGGDSPGADGLSMFLYDPAGNMAGAAPGGGLGYCRGTGGWLGLGLDEFGNFSHPQDSCGNGPGQRPQSLVLRGPTSAGHPLVAHAVMPGGVDKPGALQRPQPTKVLMRLAPAEQGAGFRVTVDAHGAGGWSRLADGVPFPHMAPSQLRLGFAGSTGGLRNIHEVRDIAMQPFIAARVRHSFHPGAVKVGEGTTLTLSLASMGGTVLLAKPLMISLPPGVKVANPAGLGGSCRGSVTARANADHVVVEAGTTIGAEPCTLLFELLGVAAGRWTHEIVAGSVVTDWGHNTAASAANISVD